MLVKPAPPFRLLHRRLINVPALQARPYIRPDGIYVKSYFSELFHQLFPDPSSCSSGCRCQCCLSNENETFLLDNETRSCCWAHAITCPPLTNKEGKKRGAGNDTRFGDTVGCQMQPRQGPVGVRCTRTSEICQRERDHAAASCCPSS